MQATRATGFARVLGPIALFALFAAGFSVTAAGLRSLIELPFGMAGGAKLEVFREQRDEIDLLILGSSYLAHGIDPAVVDPIVSADLGRPFRSFNLGLDAARGLEIDHLIRSLLRTPPARLRWVVIEAPVFEGWIPERFRSVSERLVYWHSLRQTRTALEQLAVEQASREETLELARLHLWLFGMRATNLGTGEELFRSLADLRPGIYRLMLASARERNGFVTLEALEKVRGGVAQLRQNLHARPDAYRRALEEFRPGEIEPGFEHYATRALADQAAFLVSRGITPIYVVPPVLKPVGGFSELAREGHIQHLWVYADPDRHAALYELSSRWDEQHTSERGSRLWSEQLARDLGGLIRQQEAAP